jgi:predicted XRE-type DNA-binding protein
VTAPTQDQFIRESAHEFSEAKGQPESIRKILIQYLQTGAGKGYSQAELIDFLGVSTPSVLDLAEYPEEDQNSVMQLLAGLKESEIQK